MRVFQPELLLAFAVIAISRSAHADDADSCAVAYARGQEERLSGRLYSARGAFLECAKGGCPATMASDCRRWVKEVEADLPTVRVTVRDDRGVAIESARISIDGESVSATALSAPIVLEAGPHELRAEAPGYDPVAGA